MDFTLFARLRPKQRTDEYADQVLSFVTKCAKDPHPAQAYYQVVRSCRCIDAIDTRHLLSYRTPVDWYRVRTKIRRCEVRSVFFLTHVEAAKNEELEADRFKLIETGYELISLYDTIIKECS